MKVLEAGHVYELETYENKTPLTLMFISKKGKEIVHDGVTNEELLDVLIDRMKWLDNRLPSPENQSVIEHLELSLELLKFRTAQRLAQNVEGTDLPHESKWIQN